MDAEALRQNGKPDPLVMRLKRVMGSHGFTLQDVADGVGCHRVAVSYWRTGTRRPSGLYRQMLERFIVRKERRAVKDS